MKTVVFLNHVSIMHNVSVGTVNAQVGEPASLPPEESTDWDIDEGTASTDIQY